MCPKRMTREQARLRTRERILDAAQALFSKQGYRNTSLEEIAEKAGFSKGAVYSNWVSKEALFLELLDEVGSQQNLEARTNLTPTRWALATLEFFLEAIDSEDTRTALAQRYEKARTETAHQFSGGRPDPEWGTWEELSTIAMALGSGLIIQNAIDPKAVDPTLLPRILQRLMPIAPSP
ncbi:MAG: helix-turn-helix domain-containing protein [Acidimicrobiia bacterium]|jgi:AcrR family transcriptional regulator